MCRRRDPSSRWTVRCLKSAVCVLVASLLPLRAFAQDAPRGPEGAVPRGPGGAVIRPAEPEAPAPGPKIVPPVVKKNVEPTYPPDALAAGLQAVVNLKITVSKEGKVTAAEVIEPVGHGFDEAAK